MKQVRDAYTLRLKMAVLRSLAQRSDNFREVLSYDENLRLISAAKAILVVAQNRPSNWQAFLRAERDFFAEELQKETEVRSVVVVICVFVCVRYTVRVRSLL